MLLSCVLPDKKLFRQIPGTDSWECIWELRLSNRLRIYSHYSNPWNKQINLKVRVSRTGNQNRDQVRRVNRFDLIIDDSATKDEVVGVCEILFEFPTGFAYYTGRNYGVYSFPVTDPRSEHETVLMVLRHPAGAASRAQKAKSEPRDPSQKQPSMPQVEPGSIDDKPKTKVPSATSQKTKPIVRANLDQTAAAVANEGLSNEERIEQSIALVKGAVADLKQEFDWDTIALKQRIKLIQAKVREKRGTSISQQTLYREWCKHLWR